MCLSNAKRLGLAPVLFLADSPHCSGVLSRQEASNQLRGFTFVFNFKIIVFEFYNFTYPQEMIF